MDHNAQQAAHFIPDLRYVAIDPQRPMGHVSGAGISAPENESRGDSVRSSLW